MMAAPPLLPSWSTRGRIPSPPRSPSLRFAFDKSARLGGGGVHAKIGFDDWEDAADNEGAPGGAVRWSQVRSTSP